VENWPVRQGGGIFSPRWGILDKISTGIADLCGYGRNRIPQPPTNDKIMKLFITALCASMLVIPMSYAEECEKGKCEKEKKEGTLLSDCGKCEDKKDKDCEKKECDDEKKEGTLLSDCGKCEDKKDKDCEKKECDDEKKEGTFAGNCGKCKKDGDSEEKKEEGTLI
jgi:hypothetical protein